MKKTTSLSEMKRKNKLAGHYFFAKGNPPVIAKKGDYLITRGFGGGSVLYKYNSKNGHIQYVKHGTKAELLKHSIIRSLILTKEKVYGISFKFSKNNLVISSKNSFSEESEETVEVDYDGNEFEVGFNGKYILDVLNVIDIDFIEMHFVSENSACLMYPLDNDHVKYVVMPMRL